MQNYEAKMIGLFGLRRAAEDRECELPDYYKKVSRDEKAEFPMLSNHIKRWLDHSLLAKAGVAKENSSRNRTLLNLIFESVTLLTGDPEDLMMTRQDLRQS